MTYIEDARMAEKDRADDVDALIAAAEKLRTPRDREYAQKIDSCIAKAAARADQLHGDQPSLTRDPARHYAWGQAWSRAFHEEIDRLTRMRGYRCQSHQA